MSSRHRQPLELICGAWILGLTKLSEPAKQTPIMIVIIKTLLLGSSLPSVHPLSTVHARTVTGPTDMETGRTDMGSLVLNSFCDDVTNKTLEFIKGKINFKCAFDRILVFLTRRYKHQIH